MSDEEQAPSSRKRVAGTQINKDNPEPDDDGPEQEMGTFKKATEEVMATQRIVKVRHQQTSSAPSSNPFSAIRFAPTDSSAQTSAPVPEVQPSDVKADEGSNGSGKHTLSVPDKNAGSGVNTDSAATTEAPPQPVETSDKAEDTKDESGGDKVVVGEPKESSSMPSEVEGKTKEGDAEEKERADEAGNNDKISKDDTEKKDGGESETKDGFSDEQRDADKISKDDTEKKGGGESEQKDADNKGHTSSATPLFSFKNLSSGQNAFTSLTGTGFSSTSFSFGSASKDGSSSGPLFGLKADGSSFPSFNLGTANNGSSATVLATSAEAPKKFAMTEGPVETGEENENAVFTADSALYEYLDGGWKERGKGELKLNVPVSGGESGERARLVMRTKGNYRLVLNASLYNDMSLKDMDKKGVMFACMSSIGESPSSLATFALKFKDTVTREEFKDAVESHKTSKAPDVQLKTPENSPKAAEV
ncbi:nuclear pore complex protein NUP50A-like [Miscanthus floridulus]|uniref:nuclear pore complex protein NUP50A-like n=1 Tax=Miscanthus floridulus TaxID=154761 RepID=UPI0034579D1F